MSRYGAGLTFQGDRCYFHVGLLPKGSVGGLSSVRGNEGLNSQAIEGAIKPSFFIWVIIAEATESWHWEVLLTRSGGDLETL